MSSSLISLEVELVTRSGRRRSHPVERQPDDVVLDAVEGRRVVEQEVHAGLMLEEA